MKTIVLFGFVLGALCAAGEVIVAKRGQAITLKCGVKGFSSRLTWNRGNDLIISVDGKNGLTRKGGIDLVGRSKVKKQTDLEISAAKEEDAGKFICEADGRRQEHTVVMFSVSASPPGELQLGSVATLQCQVKGLDPNPPVRWKKPDGSSHSEQSNAVQLKSVARSDEGTWECTFTYEGGTHRESLAIKVQETAPETVAPSSPSQITEGVLKPTCRDCDTHPHSLLGLSWWVWVAVGVGCLVVVLLIVCVIVMCKRIKRRKRKFQTMKNGRQPLKPKKYCQCDRQAAAAKPQQGRRREKPSAPPLQPLLMQ